MLFVQLFLIITSAIYTVLLFLFAFTSGKTLKAIGINSFSGVILLSVLSVLKGFLGLNIFFNLYTILLSLIWGIPGVILQILTNALIF